MPANPRSGMLCRAASPVLRSRWWGGDRFAGVDRSLRYLSTMTPRPLTRLWVFITDLGCGRSSAPTKKINFEPAVKRSKINFPARGSNSRDSMDTSPHTVVSIGS